MFLGLYESILNSLCRLLASYLPFLQDGEEIPVDTKDEASEEASRKSSGGSKSWASLFHKDSPGGAALNHVTGKPMARIQPYTNVNGSEEEASLEGSGKPDKKKKTEGISSNAAAGASSLDPHNLELAKFLQSYGLSHRSCMIKPRGLSNRSNWCFVNAILQALVACPPFYNLMKSLPQETLRKASMVKITRVINDFVAEFSPLDHFPKLNRRDKGKKTEDLPLGMTFEASSIFQFLLCLSSETFRVEEGRQEDAEEFLTFLLNALNDEMLALVKLLNEDQEQEQRSEGEDDDDDDEWHQVGAKNKSLLTRRVGSSGASQLSPVGSIFQGQLQSCVTSSNGEPTATLQTFFTLPLDIQSKNIKNVSEALLHNFTSETIDE
jgi:ubiquitin carboxyl-terminal hydrolase 10